MTATRRLAAILAADVAGYSRLMGADEEAACATGEGGARRPQGVPSTMLRSAVAALRPRARHSDSVHTIRSDELTHVELGGKRQVSQRFVEIPSLAATARRALFSARSRRRWISAISISNPPASPVG
jgi:hypothetical protein